MAWFSLHFLSDALRQETTLNIVLPEMKDGRSVSFADRPVVWLLHGYTNNQNRWLLDTNVHYLAKHYGIAVVMPYGGNSFYADTVAGGDYETYLMAELPQHLKCWFNIAFESNDSYIAGNSMGAVGAAKYALTYPGRFKALAAFSGPLDIGFVELAAQLDPDTAKSVTHDFADMSAWKTGGANDPAEWIRLYKTRLDNGRQAPLDITVACGRDDQFLPLSEAFVAKATAAGVPIQWKTSSGGHDFLYWQHALADWLEYCFADRVASA